MWYCLLADPPPRWLQGRARARPEPPRYCGAGRVGELALHQLLDLQLELQRFRHLAEDARRQLIDAADGDARRLLNLMEIAAQFAETTEDGCVLPDEMLPEIIGTPLRRFDKGGDLFYDQISALHKSMRGTDPDAVLYWFCRMIDGGCDPRYIARRAIRMASEDVGNADPRALTLTLDAAESYERLGSPEGELALAQALVYLSLIHI